MATMQNGSGIAFPKLIDRRDKAEALPRKVVLATMMYYCQGTLEERLEKMSRMIDDSAALAKKQYPHHPLDIVVMPENVFLNTQNIRARSVTLEGPVLEKMQSKARQHNTNLIVTLNQIAQDGCVYNTAVVLDRTGGIIGTYRKVHPVGAPNGTLENGITPGNDFPVFDCDFGRIGIQICWDMSYDDGFAVLENKGAEIVFIPTASPQTVRPSSYALNHRYYVATSTRRNNASVINPAGMIAAQTTSDPILVQQIDLSYSILHWTAALENGESLTRQFGDKVGYLYSEREDCGVFWSNDPERSISSMCKELGLKQFQDQVEQDFEKQTAERRV